MLRNLKYFDFRRCIYDVGITTPILQLSFRISKSSTNWKPSRQNSYWANNILLVIIRYRLFRLLVFRENLTCGCLVNLPSCFYYSVIFIYIRRFVVPAQRHNIFATPWYEYSSAITHVCSIADLSNDKHNDRAWSRPFNNCELASRFVFLLAHLEKPILCFCKTFDDRLLRFSGKAIFFDDVMMKVVSKKLSTCTSTVAIVNSEKRAFRPGFMLPLFWLNYV